LVIQIYEEDTTIKHIKALAFNRTASSTGETEAIKYIEKTLMESGISSKIEHFIWTGPIKLLMRLTYGLILTYLILSQLFLVVITYFIIKYMFERFRRITFVSNEESKNLCAHIQAKENIPNRPLVIISAHYDSISTTLPYRMQVVLFFIYRLIVIFYAFIIFVFAAIFALDYFSIIPLSNFLVILITFTSIGGVFISIPILYVVFIERSSPGSIDNASGVAISIELAKIFKKDPLEKMDLLFIWTGAEEWGLKGSISFCKKHYLDLMKKYNFDQSLNINFDMVGTYIGLLNKTGLILKKKMNNNLNEILQTTAKNLNIPLNVYTKVIKPKSDHRTFQKFAKRKRKKLQVAFFHSDKDSKYIHSSRDTPDKCNIENLNGCLNICHQALRSIDLRVIGS
jgi:hypothetical protein